MPAVPVLHPRILYPEPAPVNAQRRDSQPTPAPTPIHLGPGPAIPPTTPMHAPPPAATAVFVARGGPVVIAPTVDTAGPAHGPPSGSLFNPAFVARAHTPSQSHGPLPSLIIGRSEPSPSALAARAHIAPYPLPSHTPMPMPSGGAEEGIAVADPNQRDPNAALDSYDRRMRVETLLGVVFVVAVVAVAVGLWVGLDKSLRARLLRWGRAVVGCRRTKAARERDAAVARGGLRDEAEKARMSRASMRASFYAGQGQGPRRDGSGMPLGAERIMRVTPSVLQAQTSDGSTSTTGTLYEKPSGSSGGGTVIPTNVLRSAD